MKVHYLVVGFAFFGVVACSSEKNPQAAPDKSSSASEGKPPIEDMQASLVELRDNVNKLTESIQDPSSAKEDETFRSRVKAEEKRLRERTAWLRKNLNRLFPAQTDTATDAEQDDARQQMFKDLEKAEDVLDGVAKAVDEDSGETSNN